MIRILKGLSWAKVAYNLIFDIPALLCFNNLATEMFLFYILFFTFLGLLLTGIIAFAITLHCGKVNGLLDLENHDTDNVASEMNSFAANDTTVGL